jgi:hypothetical protein
LIRWIGDILCSYVAFSSIVLFDMLLRSNDFKGFVISEYRKYDVSRTVLLPDQDQSKQKAALVLKGGKVTNLAHERRSR